MWEYTEKVMDYFLNPRNMGEIENPDAIGDVGSIACGDALKLMLKIDDDGIIKDAKFQTFGCASAIASSSALTELIIGKHVSDVESLTNDDIAGYLGGLPKEKLHCSVMGHEALEAALRDYKGLGPKIIEGNMVCECFNVTDLDIIKAVEEKKVSTLEEVTNYLKAGGGCGNCHDSIQEILDETLGISKIREESTPETMTGLQKIRLIESTIDKVIRPALNRDGGDIELIDVVDNKIKVRLTGACASCASSKMTLNNFVTEKLREKVAPDLVVEESVL